MPLEWLIKQVYYYIIQCIPCDTKPLLLLLLLHFFLTIWGSDTLILDLHLSQSSTVHTSFVQTCRSHIILNRPQPSLFSFKFFSSSYSSNNNFHNCSYQLNTQTISVYFFSYCPLSTLRLYYLLSIHLKYFYLLSSLHSFHS